MSGATTAARWFASAFSQNSRLSSSTVPLAPDDANAALFEPFDFAGIVGVQIDGLDFEGLNHGGGEVIRPQVVVKSEVDVGIDGVIALFLQAVGGDFVGESDAASLLTHI